MFKAFVVSFLCVSSAFLFVEASAEPKIDLTADRGVFLVLTSTGENIAAQVAVLTDPGTKPDDLTVYVATPGGKRFPLSFWGENKENKQLWTYVYGPVPLHEILGTDKDGSGTYVISIVDKNDKELASATDSLVDRVNDKSEVMNYFDEKLMSPSEGAVIKGDTVVFRWSPVKDGAFYMLRVYSGPEFDPRRRVLVHSTQNTSLEVPTSLLRSGTFYWRLEAIAENGADVDNTVRYGTDAMMPRFTIGGQGQ